jgi:hypothetical protein
MAEIQQSAWVEPYMCGRCHAAVLTPEQHRDHMTCVSPPKPIGPVNAFVHGLAVGISLASLGFGLWLRAPDAVGGACALGFVTLISLKAHT